MESFGTNRAYRMPNEQELEKLKELDRLQKKERQRRLGQ